MKRQIYFIIGLSVMLSVSCNPYSSRLKDVLEYSGENRRELEQVLEHYAANPADSLKLKAAVFLMENMPGHYTLGGPYMDKYLAKVDTLKDVPYHVKKVIQTIPYHYPYVYRKLKILEDVKCIKADFLIYQIDKAFQQWEENPWLAHTSFEYFCNYLLPYRVENEPLDNWRDSIRVFQEKLKEKMEWYDDSRFYVDVLQRYFYFYSYNRKVKVADPAFKDYDFDCIPISHAELFAMRILGIPCAIDFTPSFANRNNRHYWATAIDPQVKNTVAYQVRLNTVGKIYRRTFAHNPVARSRGKEYIPSLFLDPFNKDVTDLYLETADVTLKVPRKVSNRYVYLAVFNDLMWKPVACAEVSGGEVTFRKMGKDVMYLPIYYDENKEIKPLAFPFLLAKNGSVHFMQGRSDSLQTLCLTRKYTYLSQSDYWTRSTVNTSFECADNRSFSPPIQVGTIERQLNYSWENMPVTVEKKYRYWRYYTKHYTALAELQFVSPEGQELEGKLFGPDSLSAKKMFDHDPLTYADVRSWMGVDFGKPVEVAEIRFLPHNDANGVYPGNEYELMYYHYPEGWKSLGIQIATGNSITYKNVPVGGLYWLRNHTTGKEERIFTWQKGRAQFW